MYLGDSTEKICAEVPMFSLPAQFFCFILWRLQHWKHNVGTPKTQCRRGDLTGEVSETID